MLRWSCVFAVLFVVGLGGCSGGGQRLLPGAMCKMSNECNDRLVCIYGECHVQCKEAKDCGPGQLCAGPAEAGVCLLEEEETCGLNSHCEGDLICAIDLKCRSQCEAKKDCPTPTQECVPSVSDANVNVCAEPAEAPNGVLSAPDAGATTDAGADAAPSDAGADAAPSDSGSDGTAGSDAAAGDAPPSVKEMEPNENRDQPNPYTPGTIVTGSVGSDTDVDYYETMVPAGDLAGGYYQASITGVGEGLLVHADVYTASDNERIHQATPATAGASLLFYWAAAAGQKYGIAVSKSRTLSLPNQYTLQIVYTKVNDTFEPNDTSGGDAPKLVAAGVPATGYFFAGFKTRLIDPVEYQDWFALDLPAGMNTITLANVAGNWRPIITLMDDMGNPFGPARVIAMAAGAGISKPFMVTTPGRYRALIEGYGNQGIVEAGTAPMVPDNFTKPYTFTVSQP